MVTILTASLRRTLNPCWKSLLRVMSRQSMERAAIDAPAQSSASPTLLAFFITFATELLELGEDGVHIQLARLFLRLGPSGNLGLLARGGLGGWQQGCAGVDRCRLFFVRALHFEIEIDLRSETECHRVHRCQVG